jgi:hypothetical protein
MTALNLSTRLGSEESAGDYEGPLYAPHPDLKERRAELGLPTPEPVSEVLIRDKVQ